MGGHPAKIFTVGSYSTDCTEIYTSLSVRVHIFVSSWKLLFLKPLYGIKLLFICSNHEVTFCIKSCVYTIKIEGLVLQKTCRYKEITCGVPQGSVLVPISYPVQKWKFQKIPGVNFQKLLRTSSGPNFWSIYDFL